MTLPPGYYRHYKGGLYHVHALAHDTRTEEEVVIYTPCYPCSIRYFTRPLSEWFAVVTNAQGESVTRFTWVRE